MQVYAGTRNTMTKLTDCVDLTSASLSSLFYTLRLVILILAVAVAVAVTLFSQLFSKQVYNSSLCSSAQLVKLWFQLLL